MLKVMWRSAQKAVPPVAKMAAESREHAQRYVASFKLPGPISKADNPASYSFYNRVAHRSSLRHLYHALFGKGGTGAGKPILFNLLPTNGLGLLRLYVRHGDHRVQRYRRMTVFPL